MKNPSKALLVVMLLGALGSCKKKDNTQQDMGTKTDTVSTTTPDTMSNPSSEAGRGRLKKHHQRRELTTDQKDSIKAERDKIVTPPSNTGASMTPGSGRAVPGNNKVGAGTNASEGSSTGATTSKK